VRHPITWLDVFTSTPLTGNALAVARTRGTGRVTYVQQTHAVDPDAGTAHARGFFLAMGALVEDPATGSAAGPLLACLEDRAGMRSPTIRQGDEIGRPSRIGCSWAEDRPRVAGDVVIVADGHVSL